MRSTFCFVGKVEEFVVDDLGRVVPRKAAATGAGICDEFFPFVLVLATTTGCEEDDPTNQSSTLASEEVAGTVAAAVDDDDEDDIDGMISFSLFFTLPGNHPAIPLSTLFKASPLLLVVTVEPGRTDINCGGGLDPLDHCCAV